MKLKRTTLRLLIATALIISTIVSPAAAQQQAPQPESAIITGRVERNGTPLPNTPILLRRRGERDLAGTTDASGNFTFTNVTPSDDALIIVTAGEDITTNYVQIRAGRNSVTITFDPQSAPAPTQPQTHAEETASQHPSDQASPQPAGRAPSTQMPQIVVQLPATPPAGAAAQPSPQTVAQASPSPTRQAASTVPARSSTTSPASSSVARRDQFCQTSEGAIYPFDTTRFVTLNDLLNDIKLNFNVNFAPDPDVQNIKIRAQIQGVPWTSILRLLLEQNGLEAVCYQGQIVRIMTRARFDETQARARREAPRREVKLTLKYIRPTQSGPVDLGNQPVAGGGINTSATLQSVEQAIRRILKASGDDQSDVSQIPGTSTFLIYGTDDQIERIERLISEIDVPQPQVEIRALVITDSANFLSDIGFQLAGVAQVGNTVFGITTIPSQTAGTSSTGGSSSGGNNQLPTAGLRPGQVPVLTGITPSNTLSASSASTGIGLNSLIGSTQLTAALTLAQTRGQINIQSRYRTVVGNGKPTLLQAGQSIPVPVTAIAGGANVTTGVTFVNATRSITVTPQVAERGTDGRTRIVLTLKINNDSVDTSLATVAGQPPAINTQSVQTELEVADGEVVILGGVDVDTVSNSRSNAPGFLGWILKRNQRQTGRDRLYFLIQPILIEPGARISNLAEAPPDALLAPVPPPGPQKPGPYDRPRH